MLFTDHVMRLPFQHCAHNTQAVCIQGKGMHSFPSRSGSNTQSLSLCKRVPTEVDAGDSILF